MISWAVTVANKQIVHINDIHSSGQGQMASLWAGLMRQRYILLKLCPHAEVNELEGGGGVGIVGGTQTTGGEGRTIREKGNIIKVENDGLEDEVLLEVVRTWCVLAVLWR